MHSFHLGDNNPTHVAKQVNVEVTTSAAIPYAEWPLWAKAISLLKSDADKGIGDVVERTIGPTNSAKFKEWYQKTFGKSCSCNTRKNRWNEQYPFKSSTS